MKAVLRGKFVAIQFYNRKQGSNESLKLILKVAREKKEETEAKVSRRKEIIQIRE